MRCDFLKAFCSWVQCRLNSYAKKSALFRFECSTRRDELLGKKSKGTGFCIHVGDWVVARATDIEPAGTSVEFDAGHHFHCCDETNRQAKTPFNSPLGIKGEGRAKNPCGGIENQTLESVF